MINQRTSIHKLKVEQFKTPTLYRSKSKYEHILYRFVPDFIFKAKNDLTRLFSNGLAVMVAKLVSNMDYLEGYFEVNERRFNEK